MTEEHVDEAEKGDCWKTFWGRGWTGNWTTKRPPLWLGTTTGTIWTMVVKGPEAEWRLGQLNTLFIICCCSISMSLSAFWSPSLADTWSASTTLVGASIASSCVLPSLLFDFLFFNSSSVDTLFLQSLTVLWSFSIISFILRTCFLL